MIVCISTVLRGGMPQFASQIFLALNNAGVESRLILPKSKDINIEGVPENKITFFSYPNSLTEKRLEANRICNSLLGQGDEIWFCDETTLSMMIAEKCKNSFKVFVHDPNQHLYSFQFKRYLRFLFMNYKKKIVYKKAEKIVLMSESSKKVFTSINSDYINKIQLLRLGAHIQTTEVEYPKDLTFKNDYFLFFGTIEKYKNILGLLTAFEKYDGNKKLVIAGKGEFSEKEREIINRLNHRVCILNRFIRDEEMAYLFTNALSVFLPYIEASQSGVLTMSYHFSKPVIVSNLPGLTEFVIDGSTGFVFKNEHEFIEKMHLIETHAKSMGENAKQYENSYLDFNKNVLNLLVK